MSKKALIVIDIQNEYFKGGNMELVNPEKASINAGRIINHFRQHNLPVVHIQHLSADANVPAFVPGTSGSELHENVKPAKGKKIIQKNYPNSFRETDLLDYLKANNTEEVIIAGMMTHMCVDATTRAAKDYGFACTVISDACASKDLEINNTTVKAADVHNAFLAALAFFYAEIKTTANYIA